MWHHGVFFTYKVKQLYFRLDFSEIRCPVGNISVLICPSSQSSLLHLCPRRGGTAGRQICVAGLAAYFPALLQQGDFHFNAQSFTSPTHTHTHTPRYMQNTCHSVTQSGASFPTAAVISVYHLYLQTIQEGFQVWMLRNVWSVLPKPFLHFQRDIQEGNAHCRGKDQLVTRIPGVWQQECYLTL